MSAEPGIDEGLRLVRAESEALLADLRALGPADWRHPSNCPPWDVAMVAAHVSSGGGVFFSNIQPRPGGGPYPPPAPRGGAPGARRPARPGAPRGRGARGTANPQL